MLKMIAAALLAAALWGPDAGGGSIARQCKREQRVCIAACRTCADAGSCIRVCKAREQECKAGER